MTDSARSLLGTSLFIALIVLPIFTYLKVRRQKDKRIVLSIFAIWILWSAANAPIHEGAHALAGLLVGMHIRGGQFIQHFWQGDFVHGYVLWKPASVHLLLFSTTGPYIADFLIAFSAILWIPWNRCSPFLGALTLSLTFFRSAFDVAVNYCADMLFGGKGDFGFLLSGYPRWMVHTAALLIILLSLAGGVRQIILARRLDRSVSTASQVSVTG